MAIGLKIAERCRNSRAMIAKYAIGRDAARVPVEQHDRHFGLRKGGMDALCPLVCQADDQPIDATLEQVSNQLVLTVGIAIGATQDQRAAELRQAAIDA